MSVVVITPPSALISVALAQKHLRLDTDDDADLLGFYIAAAQAMIDGPAGWLGRCVGVQTLELRLDGFPSSPIWGWGSDSGGLFWGSTPAYGGVGAATRVALPYPPLISVTSVTYEDQAGTVQNLPSADYLASDEGIDASFGTAFPTGRWEPNAVRIQYQAGYPSTPPAVAAAMLLMVGDLYSNRESVETGVRAAAVTVPMSTTVENLLAPYRVYG